MRFVDAINQAGMSAFLFHKVQPIRRENKDIFCIISYTGAAMFESEFSIDDINSDDWILDWEKKDE